MLEPTLLQTSDAELIASLLQYGVLGLVVIALLTGWLHPKSSVDSKDKEIERLSKRLDLWEEQIIKVINELYAFIRRRQP